MAHKHISDPLREVVSIDLLLPEIDVTFFESATAPSLMALIGNA